MHAGWNLLARQQREEALFIGRMTIVIATIGLVPGMVSEAIARSLPPFAWWCLIGSGICCGVYYYALARAYGEADFTTVYPITRATPVILLGIVDTLRGRSPTVEGLAGMLAVALGCLLTPLYNLRDLSLRKYLNKGIMWMLLTACGTVGYSFLDKIASEAVAPGAGTAARYGYFFFLVSGVTFWLLDAHNMRNMLASSRLGWGRPAIGAVMNFAAYWLVLWAYQLTRRVSYIVAFRQFSIVIGVVLGFLLYHEEGLAVRLVGSLLITVGLVAIALWGR